MGERHILHVGQHMCKVCHVTGVKRRDVVSLDSVGAHTGAHTVVVPIVDQYSP